VNRQIQRAFNEDSNIKAVSGFINPSSCLAFNFSQSIDWLDVNTTKRVFVTLNRFNIGIASCRPPSWMINETNRDLSLGIPLIFSISENAMRLISRSFEFKKDVMNICNAISDFVSDRDLTAIGEISIFQEDETEPKLFITYGIANKQYQEILRLWDDACEQLAKSTSVSSLEKIAVVFDQL
jgi:hypothetical protein